MSNRGGSSTGRWGIFSELIVICAVSLVRISIISSEVGMSLYCTRVLAFVAVNREGPAPSLRVIIVSCLDIVEIGGLEYPSGQVWLY